MKSELNVLFLSSDTGGGHRASAESLAAQFLLHYPGSRFTILDILDDCLSYPSLTFPMNTVLKNLKKNNMSVPDGYKYLSSHPSQWRWFYHMTNTRASEYYLINQISLGCESGLRKRIKELNPDVVVSVHPLMTYVPLQSCQEVEKETGKHIPMYTVVTDLGSAHSLWFANGVDKMFIASEQIRNLAIKRGKVPEEKMIKLGLPIRHDFSIQARRMGDRTSPEGQAYQKQIREEVNVPIDGKVVLLMGGGEGVGSLSSLVNALYVELARSGVNSTILVVCGRNKKLKIELENRDWDSVLETGHVVNDCWVPTYTLNESFFINPNCLDSQVTTRLKRMLSSTSLSNAIMCNEEKEADLDSFVPFEHTQVHLDISEDLTHLPPSTTTLALSPPPPEFQTSCSIVDGSVKGKVKVIPLGFVTNIAQYMVAADLLVTKAGPGTIAEAASVGLPIVLTSFLPGQEEGNVEFVTENKFGTYSSDINPVTVAELVADWLLDERKLMCLSKAAASVGEPDAASLIVDHIGKETIKFKQDRQ